MRFPEFVIFWYFRIFVFSISQKCATQCLVYFEHVPLFMTIFTVNRSLAMPLLLFFLAFSYAVDMDIKKTLADTNLTNPESRLKARQSIKAHFEDRYLNQATFKSEKKASGNNYFFKKLRF